MRYDAILFDLDGTLADTIDDIASSMAHATASLGLEPPSGGQVRGAVGAGVRKLVERLVADETKRDAVREAFLAHYAEHLLDRTRLFPQVAETLAALGGMPMGVVTNKPEESSRRILEGLGIARHFRVVCGGDTLPVRKPDPAVARRALAELGGTRPLLVGDSGTDIETARGAGIPCCAVTYGYHKPGELERADFRIERFGDLLGLVRGE